MEWCVFINYFVSAALKYSVQVLTLFYIHSIRRKKQTNKKTPERLDGDVHQLVGASDCHVAGAGSIPRRSKGFFLPQSTFSAVSLTVVNICAHAIDPVVHVRVRWIIIIIIIIIYPLTARVVGALQMISQFSPFFFSVLHCPLGLAELQSYPFPDVVFSSLLLSALFSFPTVPCKMILARPDERET